MYLDHSQVLEQKQRMDAAKAQKKAGEASGEKRNLAQIFTIDHDEEDEQAAMLAKRYRAGTGR
jgi:hypothetical protein